MNRDPVLRLGGLDIKVLSGPVSMYYLRPITLGMPLVLLFGDAHREKKNLKRDCDEEDGCYLIYSNSFLLGLDALAKRYPVDFFLEYGDESLAHGRKDILFGELRYKVDGCTDTRLRKESYEYEDKCPTRSIRFHKSDPRRFYQYIESKATELYNDYFLNRDETEIKARPQEPFVVSVFKDALDLIHRGEMGGIPEVMMRLIQHKYSVCRKQIQKVRVEVDWRKMFVFMDLTLKGVEDYVKVYRDHTEEAEKVIQATLNGTYLKLTPTQQHFRGLLSSVLLYMNSWFTDLYTIARMFKTPEDNTPSYLSLGMFGVAHTRNMARFLSDIGYEVVYRHDEVSVENAPVRHVYILQDLNVDRDVEEFKGEDVYPYRSRLEYEQEERNALRQEEKKYPFNQIDEAAKRLYGIRAYENLMYMEAGELRSLMKHITGNFSGVLSSDELAYVENCASDLARFIIVGVCQHQLNRKRIQAIAYACIIASMKYIIDKVSDIYDLVGKVYPDLFEKQYLVMEMVEDIELRTDFQLCNVKSISRNE